MSRATPSRTIRALVMLLAAIALTCSAPRAEPTAATREVAVRSASVERKSHRLVLPAARADIDGEAGLVHAYPPLVASATLAAAAVAPGPFPLVLMLHGMCGEPRSVCEHWSEGGRHGSWLVCPRGNVPCGEDFDWRGDGEEKARHLDAAAASVRARFGALVAPAGDDVLIGFSRGAFVARDVAYARPGRYRGLILIGAALSPDPERLRAAGIARVVLASGDHDGARPTMIQATAKLIRAGVDARFVSTGPIYHQLPANLDEILAPAIAWIRAAG
jgi:predicted esterase